MLFVLVTKLPFSTFIFFVLQFLPFRTMADSMRKRKRRRRLSGAALAVDPPEADAQMIRNGSLFFCFFK